MANQGLVRIVFELDPRSWHGMATERLWAEPVGGDRYRLRNVPFFALGVGVEDIVHAEQRDDGLYFTKASIHAGHSTYRLQLRVPRVSKLFDAHWQPLQALGCSYEQGDVIAVDVPPAADLYAVYPLLEAGERAGAWEFEEGHVGHALRDR